MTELARSLSAALLSTPPSVLFPRTLLAFAMLQSQPPQGQASEVFLQIRDILEFRAVIPPSAGVDASSEFPQPFTSKPNGPTHVPESSSLPCAVDGDDSDFFSMDEGDEQMCPAIKHPVRTLDVEKLLTEARHQGLYARITPLVAANGALISKQTFAAFTPDLSLSSACGDLLSCVLNVWEVIVCAYPLLFVGTASDV